MNTANVVDPSKTFLMGQELLDKGQPDQAMPYFYSAAMEFIKIGLWDKSAQSYEKAAYCYEADGRYREAVLDYETACFYYDKAELHEKALETLSLSNENKKKFFENNRVIIVGVVGRNGSGKDEIVKRLKAKYDVPLMSTGDITREIAKESGIEPNRDNLHKITQECWAKYGREYYPGRIAKKVIENEWKIAGWTGIRPPSDVKIIKQFLGNNFILVNVEITDIRVRFERLAKRGEERDAKVYEDFLEQERSENEIFQLDETISMANYSILNDGTLADLHKEIDKFAEDVLRLKPKLL